MNARVIPYPEERALEDATYGQGLAPTRIFALLLPVWRVDVRADVTEAEEYGLIDRYLVRGIAEAGLDTPAELAAFFSLDEPLVDRALRSLVAIGHVTGTGERLALTDLGRRSLRDGVRYVAARQVRRELYVDALGHRPLPRSSRAAVTLLGGDALDEVVHRQDRPRFLMLAPSGGFRRDAVTGLGGSGDDGPLERVDRAEVLGHDCGHLPLYLVRAVRPGRRAGGRGTGGPGGQATGSGAAGGASGPDGGPASGPGRGAAGGGTRYLAYTQAGARPDPGVTALVERTPEIVTMIENEERDGRAGRDETRAHDWLHRRGLTGCDPVRLADGTLRVTLPGTAFGGPMPISKLGSYVVMEHDFFHVWCDDERVRRRALLERADSFVGSRRALDPATTTEQIGRIARQLGLGPLDVPAFRRMAAKAGRRGLAAQLDRLG